ncbi:terminase large subunit [Cryobacterium fucosi]|nr:terminase large subunit [Cryobacterium fucosi]
MPHQQLIADIAGEVDPKTCRLKYRKVVVLLPRQSGKTTIDLSQNIMRALVFAGPQFGGPQTITYTAQTRNDARMKFLAQEKLILRNSAFGGLYELREANGSESIQWANGSVHGLASTTEKSGHGPTLDKGTIDEAFAQIDRRVEGAMRPAMIARPNAQLWVLSTAGTLQSVYLNEEIRAGRELVLSGEPSRTCYIEYSASEDDDPDDEETWWGCMPALGWTVGIDEIRAEHQDAANDPRLFSRPYLNITDTGIGAAAVVTDAEWTESGTDSGVVGPRAFALDVTNDRSWSALSWSGFDRDGVSVSELVKHERGTHWVVPFLVKKFAQFPKYERRIYLIGASQAGQMEDAFEDADIEVVRLSRPDYAAACARYYDGIVQRTVLHLRSGQVPLDVAIGGAAWGTGDTRVWSRTNSTVDISPLVSCTVAGFGFALEMANNYDVMESTA